ncbi:geranylgeranyl diphosphate synthase CrtE [soil metagenome]
MRAMHALTERIGVAVLASLPSVEGDDDLARFHALMREYPERGGKRLRGTLVMLATEAHGGDPDEALPVAAALELFQNWVLVHDDIEDDSEERRGRPALHRSVGVPVALNVGDAMHVCMWESLLALTSGPSFDADAIRREFVWMIRRTAEGQHLDLTWVAEGRFADEAAYLEMVRLKTSAYTVTSPLRLGAHASGARPHAAIEGIGDRLGAAFQIRDDVLNLTPPTRDDVNDVGSADAYGKEFAGDLLEGKRTLILAHLFAHLRADDLREATERLAAPRSSRSAVDVAWLLARITEVGSLRYAQERAETLARGALSELADVLATLPGRAAAGRIEALLRTLAARTH